MWSLRRHNLKGEKSSGSKSWDLHSTSTQTMETTPRPSRRRATPSSSHYWSVSSASRCPQQSPKVSLSYFFIPYKEKCHSSSSQECSLTDLLREFRDKEMLSEGGQQKWKNEAETAANHFFYWCLIHQFFQLIIKPVKFPQRSDKPSQRKKEQILTSERAEPLNVWTF